MLPYVAEFVGTALLLLLGTGVVANVNLTKSGMKGGGVVVITIAWGFAVMLPAFIFGAASGAHFNPALTVALAIHGIFPWHMVPGYIVCQIAGGFVGGAITWLLFKDHLDAEESAATKLGVFCTSPSIPNYFRNCCSEIVGTFVLVFAILGINQVTGIATGLNYVFVWGIIVSIFQVRHGTVLGPIHRWHLSGRPVQRYSLGSSCLTPQHPQPKINTYHISSPAGSPAGLVY